MVRLNFGLSFILFSHDGICLLDDIVSLRADVTARFLEQVSTQRIQCLLSSEIKLNVNIKSAIILSTTATAATFTAKIPILVLYIRLFGIRSFVQYMCYATLLLTPLFYATSLTVQGVFCSSDDGEVEVEWPRLEKCINVTIVTGIVNSLVGVLDDLVVLLLPLPVIWGLGLCVRRKIGVAAVFLSGVL